MKLHEVQAGNPIQMKDFLFEHCKPYLDELKITETNYYDDNPYLFRGMQAGNNKIRLILNGDETTGIIKDVRQDRRPRDTRWDLSRVVDDMFENKFGWRPRQSAVFCYGLGANDVAAQYGDLYSIFPMGEFKYIWGPHVVDLTKEMKKTLSKHRFPYSKYKLSDDDLLDAYELLSDDLEGRYIDTDLKRASKSESEIMIGCKQYLAIRYTELD